MGCSLLMTTLVATPDEGFLSDRHDPSLMSLILSVLPGAAHDNLNKFPFLFSPQHRPRRGPSDSCLYVCPCLGIVHVETREGNHL